MPLASEVHVERALTNMAVKYKNGAFIADQILPRVKVKKENDLYFIFGREEYRREDTIRADGSEANELEWSVDTGSYKCIEYALKGKVTDRQRKNQDVPLNLDVTTMQKLVDAIDLDYEMRVEALVTSTSVITQYTTLSGNNQWDDDNFVGDIEENIDTGKETIRLAIGRDPNTIVIPSAIAKVMKRDAAVRELIKYTQSNLLVNGDLPPVLWNMEVKIPGGIHDTAAENQTAVYADIWGKDVLLAYIEPRPSLETMSLGYTIMAQDKLVRKWREEKLRTEFVEVSEIMDEKIVAAACGYLIMAAIS